MIGPWAAHHPKLPRGFQRIVRTRQDRSIVELSPTTGVGNSYHFYFLVYNYVLGTMPKSELILGLMRIQIKEDNTSGIGFVFEGTDIK